MFSRMFARDLELWVRSAGAAPEPRRFSPKDAPIAIGSDASCALRLDDPSVLPLHGMMHFASGGWTFVPPIDGRVLKNGVALLPAQAVPLAPGDRLKFGGVEVECQEPKPDEPSPVAATVPEPEPVVETFPEPDAASEEFPERAEILQPTAEQMPEDADAFLDALLSKSDAAAPTPPATPAAAPEPLLTPSRATGAGSTSPLLRMLDDLDANAPKPRVRFYMNGAFEREFEVAREGDEVVFGRSRECDVQVPDPFRIVSKRHGRIYRTWAGTFLEDLSQHGIYVNGEKVENCVALSHSDRVSLSLVERGTWGPVFIYLEREAADEMLLPVLEGAGMERKGHGMDGPIGLTSSTASSAPVAPAPETTPLPSAPAANPTPVPEAAPNPPANFADALEQAGRTPRTRPSRRGAVKKSGKMDRTILIVLVLAGVAVVALGLIAMFVF